MGHPVHAIGHVLNAIERSFMDYQKPIYEHDCDRCIFLGNLHTGPNNPWVRKGVEDVDLYICPQGDFWPTLIARDGNDGSQYMSGFSFRYITDSRYKDYPLREAFIRGVEKHIIKDEFIVDKEEYKAQLAFNSVEDGPIYIP
jgi:hypothetical protein